MPLPHFILCVVLTILSSAHAVTPVFSSFLNPGDLAVDHKELECGARRAAFKFAPILPNDPSILYDALEIKSRCDGMSLDDAMSLRGDKRTKEKEGFVRFADGTHENECIDLFVGDDYSSVNDAIDAARRL
eukprot:CAMPEP_0172515356 /NCGR_PEP_ID=MMETSP1066-20121228/267464_1 /TAXON_ID=671091 /ORGANISM="Coscinodiscus wailesii, Strain CCMP2513" /LENGTH=130 /DNA_ID=CAMNT_0013296395 /DNA_START=54 /DNA_END=442 /DNA_ORIENTATION=+